MGCVGAWGPPALLAALHHLPCRLKPSGCRSQPTHLPHLPNPTHPPTGKGDRLGGHAGVQVDERDAAGGGRRLGHHQRPRVQADVQPPRDLGGVGVALRVCGGVLGVGGGRRRYAPPPPPAAAACALGPAPLPLPRAHHQVHVRHRSSNVGRACARAGADKAWVSCIARRSGVPSCPLHRSPVPTRYSLEAVAPDSSASSAASASAMAHGGHPLAAGPHTRPEYPGASGELSESGSPGVWDAHKTQSCPRECAPQPIFCCQRHTIARTRVRCALLLCRSAAGAGGQPHVAC